MQKLETINTTQIVTESVGTKQVITESKTVVKESAEPVFKSSIARGLVEEFGYDLDERVTPDGKGGFTGGLTPQPGAAPAATPGTTPPPAVSGAPNPYQGADAAKFAAMSPEDQAWLTKGGGKPDINDQFILARAPNKGKAVATAPGGAATKPADAPAADAPAVDAGATDMSLGQAGDANAAAGAATKPADAPADAGGSINPATLAQYKALLDKLKASQGGAATTPAAPAAPTAPKKPTHIAPAPKPPTPGGATKPADLSMIDKFRTSVGIPAGGTSPTGTKESVSFEDDKTLLAIKNIRY